MLDISTRSCSSFTLASTAKAPERLANTKKELLLRSISYSKLLIYVSIPNCVLHRPHSTLIVPFIFTSCPAKMDQLEAPRGVKKLHGKKSLGIHGLKLIKESRDQAPKRIEF